MFGAGAPVVDPAHARPPRSCGVGPPLAELGPSRLGASRRAAARTGGLAAITRYAGPLDRWVILPLLRLMGSRRREALLSRTSLKGIARALDPGGDLPGLPHWEALHTPGHTPGHTAFVRREDRVVITGDALVTVDLNSVRGILLGEQKVAAPPWYTTWNWRAAKTSVAAVAQLEPRVLAGGHGIPMTGAGTRDRVKGFAERFGH